ncbi:hypothetical protein H9P43_007397 [Blastocladiella emersonii ATCC 22665]|nr:hypothetical protein H9P43_007397 [Blastocladiella emersonii ATCC 22665]
MASTPDAPAAPPPAAEPGVKGNNSFMALGVVPETALATGGGASKGKAKRAASSPGAPPSKKRNSKQPPSKESSAAAAASTVDKGYADFVDAQLAINQVANDALPPLSNVK